MSAWEEYEKKKTKNGGNQKSKFKASEYYFNRKRQQEQQYRQDYEQFYRDTQDYLSRAAKTEQNDGNQWVSSHTASANLARHRNTMRHLEERAADLETRGKQAGFSDDSILKLNQGIDNNLKGMGAYDRYLKQKRDINSQFSTSQEYDAAMKAEQERKALEALPLEELQAKYDEVNQNLRGNRRSKPGNDQSKAERNRLAAGYNDPRIVGKQNPAYRSSVEAAMQHQVEETGYDAQLDSRIQDLEQEREKLRAMLEPRMEEQYRSMTSDEIETEYQKALDELNWMESTDEGKASTTQEERQKQRQAANKLKYMQYMKKADFEQVTGEAPAFETDRFGDPKDWLYARINADALDEKQRFKIKTDAVEEETSDWRKKGYEHLTDEERKVYNYLYRTEGQKSANQYLDDISYLLNERATEKVAQGYREMVDRGGSWAVSANILKAVMSLQKGAGFAEDVWNGLTGQEIDSNSFAHRASNLSNEISQATSENIQRYWDNKGNSTMGEAMTFLYGAGQSIGENLLAMAVSGGAGAGAGAVSSITGGVMGLGAASDAVVDAKNRGVDDASAIATGLLAGIAEMAFEKYSLDKLVSLKRPETMRALLKNVLKQSGVEASEEINTELANLLSDQLINGEKSNFMITVKNYMQQGMSEEEARSKAYGDMAFQIVEAGLAGALSGGTMAMGKGGADHLGYRMSYAGEAKGIRQAGENPAGLLTYAQNLPEGDAKALAEELMGQKKVGDQEIGRLSQTVKEDISRSLGMSESAEELDSRYRQISRNIPDNLAQFAEKEYERVSKRMVMSLEESGQDVPEGAYQRAEARDVETGERVQVTGIDSVEDGQGLLLKTTAGVKSLDDLEIPDASRERLYRDAAQYDDVTARALVRHYKGNLPAGTYTRYFDSIYKTGMTGLPWKSVAQSADVMVESLGAGAEAAYNLGVRAARMQAKAPKVNQAIQHVGTGTVTDETGRGADDAMQLIDEGIAARTGYDVIVRDDLEHDANGMMSTAMQQFAFSGSASNEVAARIHELAEYGLANNPNWTKQVSLPVAEYMAQKAGYESYARMVEQYQKEYAAVEGEKSYQEAMQEAVNDALGGLFTSEEGARDFVTWLKEDSGKPMQEQQSILRRLIEFFDRLIKEISDYMKKTPLYEAAKVTAQMKLDEAKAMRQVFFDALDEAAENVRQQAQAAREGQTERGADGGKQSFADNKATLSLKTVDGSPIVWIESSGLSNKQLLSHQEVAQYIANHIGRVYTILESGQKVYIGKELPNEYTHSKYTSYLRDRNRVFLKAKNRATNELGLLIEIATNRRWEKNKHTQSKDAKFGMYRYDSSFAFPIKDNRGIVTAVRAYDAELLIRNASDGKKYLYDIVNIKENTSAALDLLGKENRKGSYKAAARGDVSNPTVSQDNSKVNTSLSENGEKDTSWQKDITERHSLNPHFSREYDAWDKKSPRVFFKVGTTSKVLQGLGIPQKDITLDSSKVIKIRAKHPGMSDDVIKQVPYILEYPVVVMQSKTDPSRITIFGDVIDADGKLVLAALELHPERNGIALDEIKIASAYGKDNPQRLLDTSPILYVDGNKKRTNAWERRTRLQLPVGRIQAGSNPTISQDNSEVNTSISENGEEDTSFLERHSLRMVSIPERDYRALVSRNEELEAKVKYLMLEFRKSVKGKLRPNQNRMDVTVGRLLRESGSAMDKATLAKRMQTLWSTVYNSEDLRFEDAMALAMDIAGEMEDAGSNSLDPFAREVLDTIRSYRIYLDDVTEGEIRHAFDSVANYKKLLRGAARIGTDMGDGISMDTLMGVLAEEYPGYFGEINAADAPVALLEKINGLRSMTDAQDEGSAYLTREEKIYEQALRLLNETTVISAHETYADKQKGKAERQRQELQEKMRQWKQKKLAEYNQRLAVEKRGISERLAQLKKQRTDETDPEKREKLQKQIDRLNLREGERVAKVKALYDRKISDHLETELRQKERERIRRASERLIRMLDRPTDQNHVAADLLPDIRALVNLLIQKDGIVNDEFGARAAKLLVRYQKESARLESFYDEDTAERLGKLSEVMGDVPLLQLDSAQLGEIRAIVEHFAHLVSGRNKMLSMERAETVTQMAENVMGDLNKMDDKAHIPLGKLREVREQGSMLLNRLAVRPEQFFSEMGGTMYGLYRQWQKGEGVWARDITEAREVYQSLREKYPVDEWLNSDETIEIVNAKDRVSLTLDEALSLYMTLLREQGREHVMGNGFVKENAVKIIRVKKGKGQKSGERKVETDDTKKTQMSLQDMIQFSQKLTKEQKAFAMELGKYLSTKMADKGNSVSRKLYGYDKFNEERYWPIYTSENYLPFSGKQSTDPQIKNKGFTKATAPHAKNPIIVRGLVNTWARHVDEMAQYHAMVLPMEDFKRVYNYVTDPVEGADQDSTKDIITRKLGKHANGYIKQFLVDINGGIRPSETERWAARGLSRFKKASVTANLSVIIQQPSAMIRAMALIDPKYFAHLKGSKASFTKAGWEELKRYAPVAIIKEMGGFDTNLGNNVTDWIRNDSSRAKKAWDFISMRGAEKMDEITWCHIWDAVKRETADLHPNLERGSEAFLEKAGERFNDVIVQTQVYDSVFSKSEIMRSKNLFAKMATTFMSEPTVSYNMLRHALVRMNRGEKGAGRYLCRTVGAYLGSVVLNSLLKALPYAMRDDEKDKNLLEKYAANAVDGILWDFTSLLPFLRDVVSLFQGYDVERADMTLLDELVKAFRRIFSGKISDFDKARGLVEATANLFGIPLKNIFRDFEAVYRTGAELVAAASGDSEAVTGAGLWSAVKEGAGFSPASDGDQMVAAILTGDDEQLERVRSRLKKEGKSESQIEGVIAGTLMKSDERVERAAKSRMQGDTQKYLALYEEIRADGFSQAAAVGAINRAINQLEKEKAGASTTSEGKVAPTLAGSDVVANLEQGDLPGAQKVIDKMMDEAEDKKKKRSSVRSSLTSHYKPLYREGSRAERQRIREMLLKLKAGGKRLYTASDLKDWAKVG